MTRTTRVFALSALAMFVLAAIAGWWLFSHMPGAEALTLRIDGETFDVSGPSGFWPADLLGGAIAGAVGLAIGATALVVVLVVVPLSLLIGLGAPLLVLAALSALAVAVVGLVMATALSPLLLLGLGIWWIARSRRRPPSTTIAR